MPMPVTTTRLCSAMLREVRPALPPSRAVVTKRAEGEERPSLVLAPVKPGVTEKPSATAVAPTTSRIDLRNIVGYRGSFRLDLTQGFQRCSRRLTAEKFGDLPWMSYGFDHFRARPESGSIWVIFSSCSWEKTRKREAQRLPRCCRRER